MDALITVFGIGIGKLYETNILAAYFYKYFNLFFGSIILFIYDFILMFALLEIFTWLFLEIYKYIKGEYPSEDIEFTSLSMITVFIVIVFLFTIVRNILVILGTL